METVTTVTGDTATVEVTVAIGFRSATTVASKEKKNNKVLAKSFSLFESVCILELNSKVWYKPEMVTAGEGEEVESGLEVSVRVGVVDGA